MLIATHLATVVAALTLLLVHVALGARLRRALGATGERPASWRWPVDAALGATALAMALLLLGAVGLLRPVAVLAATAAAAALAGRELVAAARELPRLATAPRLPALLLLLLLAAAAVAPATEWDSLMYHLRIPLWLLEQGRLAVPPDSLHVSLVGASHFATLPLLALGLPSGPAVHQVGALALTLAGTIALARAAGGTRAAGTLAAAVLLGTPVFALVAITARVDVALVLALVAAHLALLEATRAPHGAGAPPAEAGGAADARDRLLVVAALLLGGAVAIKPQAGAYAVALLALPSTWRALRRPRALALAAAAGLAVSVPWLVKNALLVGAPFAPIGAGDRLEPWLADIVGSATAPAGMDLSILRALAQAREPFHLLDAFFAPGKLTIEGEGGFYALSPALLALPLALLTARARARALGPLVVGALCVALVVVPFGQVNLRYLMPAVPALAVALAVGVEALLGDLAARPARERALLGAFALAAALWPLGGALRHRLLAGDAVLLRHAVGAATAEEVWRRHPDGTARGFAPVIANVQRRVPPDGKVLMLWEARGLPLGRESVVDVRLANWSILAQTDAPARCLAGTGITHVLVGIGSVEFYVSRGANVQAFALERFTPFRDRCLADYAVVGPGFGLFTVRPAAP